MSTTKRYESDLISTSAGDLKITFLGHGSLLFNFEGKNIYVDPFSQVADYAQLPKADLILLTHEHRDHLDPQAMDNVRTEETELILTAACNEQVKSGKVLHNGDTHTVNGILIEAVPAYNLVHKRENGQPFHPKGIGNGYILTFGNRRVYVAGDTENTPEMKGLKNIDIAFLPMNLPYTMTPEMVTDSAMAFRPKILYPYHFGETNTSRLEELMAPARDIEVRIREMA